MILQAVLGLQLFGGSLAAQPSGQPPSDEKKFLYPGQRCVATFDTKKVISQFPANLRTNENVAAVQTYGACAALDLRDPSYCALLKFSKGNAPQICRSVYFEGLIIWRDLARGGAGKLDDHDYRACGRLIGNKNLKDPAVGRYCAALQSAYAARSVDAACAAYVKAVPGVQAAQCQAALDNPSVAPGKEVQFGAISGVIAGHLFRDEKPDCRAFPFQDPFNRGACLAVFYPNTCELELQRFKESHCGLVVD